eukprot:scaffold1169_cov367-Prasinococcus_capsulatus_cf.AAC.22
MIARPPASGRRATSVPHDGRRIDRGDSAPAATAAQAPPSWLQLWRLGAGRLLGGVGGEV